MCLLPRRALDRDPPWWQGGLYGLFAGLAVSFWWCRRPDCRKEFEAVTTPVSCPWCRRLLLPVRTLDEQLTPADKDFLRSNRILAETER
jgi:hypothetical protein